MMKFRGGIDSAKPIDRKSFILGMITAFSECLSAESKKCAFSPPFYPKDYEILRSEVEKIADEKKLHLWLEKNPDMKEENKLYWWVMYKFPEVLEEYKSIRNQGYNPAWEFDKFMNLLSYGTVWGNGAKNVVPKTRRKETTIDTTSRILHKSGDWPPEKKEK